MNTILKVVMILSIITLGSYAQSQAQVTPTDFKVNETTTSTVSLAWTHDGKNVDKFLIERKPLDATTFTNVGEPKSTDRTFVDKNLSPNTQFQYRIYAVLNGKNGSPTALITGWTLSTAPTLSTPVVVSATQINVAWMSNITSGQFEIQYANNANFTNATTLPSTSSRNYSLTGLSPNTNYYIRVRVGKQTSPAATNNSDWSVTQAKTQDPTPATPSGLAISGKAETSIGVSWNAVKEANAYQLRYATDKTFVRGVETMEVNATSAKIANLASGNTYYIQVRSTATVNNTTYASGWSDAVSATTDVTLPAAPTELQMQVSTDGTQVTLNWKDNSNNETGFDIEWGETSNYGKAASVGSGVTSYLVTGWGACKAFYARVRAKNAGGTSGWLDNKTTTIIAAPTAPLNLSTGTITANSIAINWRDNSTNESEFELQYDENSNFSSPTTQKLGIGTQSSTLNSLKANTTYYFRVRANNCGGSSSWIDSKATTLGLPAQPSIPNINVSVTGTEAKIDWQDFSSNETGFEIEWGESPAYGKSASVGANVTSYTIFGLSPCKVVYVHVRSKNAAGNSNWSENKAETNPTTPSKPTGLLASATNTLGEIKLKWDDNSTNEEAFELEYDVKVDFSAPQLIKLDAGTTTTVLTGLKQNTVYYVRIRAKNCRGVSDWDVTNNKTSGPPTDPSKLVITFVGSNQIDMSWTDNADNETSYEIERSLDKTTFTKIDEINANLTSYSNKGLSASTQYYYRVRAKNAFGTSGYSNIIEPKTSALPVVVPKSPSELTLTVVSSSQIDLKWLDNSDNETVFEIERGLDGVSFSKIGEVGANVTTYSDKGLSASTKYYYRIRAKNTAGVSDYSLMKDATTSALPVVVPKSPSNLTLTVVSSSQIDLKWLDNSENETVFEIERGLDGVSFSKIGEVGANVTTYSDKVLSASTKYYYRVRAKNTAGVSDYSPMKDATTSALPVVVPKSPNELTLTVVSSSQIDLKWLDNSDNETVFEIERGLDGVSFSKIGEVGANVTTYSDKGLSGSTKYYYRVRAKNTAGVSDYSLMKDATTSALPVVVPKSPNELTLTVVSSSQIDLKWLDNSENETVFEIERGLDGVSFSKIGEVGANVTTYSDKVLSASTKYYYRVRAKNTAGVSDYSPMKDATTSALPVVVPKSPNELTLTVVSSSQIDLKWLDNSDNETVFEIERGLDGVSFSKIGEVGANVTTYSDKGLSGSTKYYYRVRAKNTAGVSDYSLMKDATTSAAPVVVPKSPNELTLTVVSSSQIDLKWLDNSENETVFEIERGLDGVSFSKIGEVGANVTTYSDKGLSASTKYYYRIRAKNTAGVSDYSLMKDATTSALPVVVPKSPSDLTLTVVSSSQIDLKWLDNSDNETVFEIERGLDGVSFSKIGEVGANVTTYSDKGLSASTKYHYRVRAKNTAGVSDYSPMKDATTSALPVVVPKSPSDLTLTVVSSSQIDLKWLDNSDNETVFEIERGLDGVSFSKIGEVGANVTSYSDKGLSASTKYHYRVRAKNTAGVSDYSLMKDATTSALPVVVPKSPNELTLTVVSSSQIDLKWLDNSENETVFEIERGLDGVSFSKIGEVGANVTTYSDKVLSASTKYYYRVRAKNTAGVSDYSPMKDATTSALPVVVPKSPNELTLTVVSSSQIDLKWLDNSDNETVFEIERGLDGVSFSKIGEVGANVTTYSDKGLSGSTKYYYRVRAKNTAGVSDYSLMKDATTSAAPVVVPKSPNELTLTVVSSSQIDLKWLDNSENETVFEIERGLDGVSFSKIGEVGANVTTYSDKGLSASTKYYYRIRAKNTAGVSDYSLMKDATTSALPVVVPKSPSDLTLTVVSSSQIDLKWLDNSDNETVFEIERGLDGVSFSKIGEVGANVTTYSDKGLSASTKYHYRVRAKNTAGVSDYSPMKDATTSALPVVVPKSPSDLTLTVVSSSQIDLKWLDNSDNETVFEIERGLDGVSFSKIGEVGANVTSYSDKGLSASTKYHYRVRAKNTAGVSDYSPMKDATTSALPVVVPKSPNELTLTVVSSSQIDLKWLDNSENETVFEIERGLDGVSFSKIGEVGANVTTYSDKGLSASTKYGYRVRAKNTAGVSGYSIAQDAVTLAVPQNGINAPSNLAVKQTPMALTLTWSDNSQDETGFEVSRSVNNETSWEVIKADLAANTTEFVDKNVRPTFMYYYRVRGFKGGTFSNYSSVVGANGPVITETNVLQNLTETLVYPNPASDVVYIIPPNGTSAKYQLLTVTGKVVSSSIAEQQTPIRLTGLETGTYFLKIHQNDEKVVTIKLFKQ